MNTLKKIIPIILILSIIIGVIYVLWLGLSTLSTLIPWYISLSILVAGALLFFAGKHFLKKEYVMQQKDSQVILSTPVQADLSVILGSTIMLIGVITSKFFFATFQESGVDAFFLKGAAIIVLVIAVSYISMNIVRLRHSLHDRVLIEVDQFCVDNGMNDKSETFKRQDIQEIELLKEFEDQSSNTKKIFSGTGEYNSSNFKYVLSVKTKPFDDQQEHTVSVLDTSDINVDVPLFVEALEIMNYSIVRRSKYELSDELWEGHNFEDGPLSKV